MANKSKLKKTAGKAIEHLALAYVQIQHAIENLDAAQGIIGDLEFKGLREDAVKRATELEDRVARARYSLEQLGGLPNPVGLCQTMVDIVTIVADPLDVQA